MVHSAIRLRGLVVLVAMVAASLVISACGGGGGQPIQTPAAAGAAAGPAATSAPGVATAGDPAAGKQAIMKYGCGRCHTIPGVEGAIGTVGPNLTAFSKLSTIASTNIPNTSDNDVQWIVDPPFIKPGTAMPVLGVTQTDAVNITAYLRTLQ
jgi:cytochrome c